MEQERNSAYGCRWQNDTVSWKPLWQGLMHDLQKGVETGRIAARFHHGLAEAVSRVGLELAETHDISTIGLNGGVWQNRLLLESTLERIQEQGLKVMAPSLLPANDGGLALGQAVVGALR
jgi:hydrogenase maturation protein HypF